MTFLNPLALLALAAAAIPILVHLFNFRRPKRVDFSSLVFLRELEKSAMQRVRIRQWLLLILRTLAIACLVLAFSRPTLTAGLAGLIGTTGPRATAVVIDNSFSMTVSERQGERLRVAKDAALQVAGDAAQGDEFFVVTTSGTAEPTPGPLRAASVGEAIARVNAGPQTRTLTEAIAHASRLVATSEHPNRDVIVLSDLQESLLGDTLRSEVGDVDRVSIVSVGSRIPANVSVESVEVVSRVVDVGQDVRIDATLRNYGPEPRPDVVASLYLEDDRVAEAVANVPAEGSVDVSFVLSPRERGWLRGVVTIDDPSFDPDNRRHFTLYVPERRSLLVVRGGGASSRYLELALSPELAEGRLTFDREVIAQSALAGRSPSAYDALMLIGVNSLSQGDITLLTQYIEEGGGVLLSPGSDVSIPSLNNFLARLGAGQIDALVGRPGGQSIAAIDRVEAGHALFEGVFEGREAIRVEQPEVFATLRYRPEAGAEQTLMQLSNGWPFLQEIRHGDGVVFLMTSAPDPSWSELAVRGLFVPLIYRSAFYLAATESAVQRDIVIGSDASIAIRGVGAGTSVSAVLPDGTEVAPEQRTVLGTTRITLDRDLFDEAGWIDLVSSGDQRLLRRVAVNLDPRESEPSLMTASEAANRIGDETGLNVVAVSVEGDPAAVRSAVQASRQGVEIWNVFLLLALGFLVAETLVSRRWRPESVPD
jgi:hypothetical protein